MKIKYIEESNHRFTKGKTYDVIGLCGVANHKYIVYDDNNKPSFVDKNNTEIVTEEKALDKSFKKRIIVKYKSLNEIKEINVCSNKEEDYIEYSVGMNTITIENQFIIPRENIISIEVRGK